MFKSIMNKGFSLTFENNLTISVQFGADNYCERRSFTSNYDEDLKNHITESNNAEIAIWNKENKWFNFGNDEVKGWVTTNEVANWIEKVSKATDINDITK